MPAINEVRESVYQRFTSEWSDETPHALENEKFNPPVLAPGSTYEQRKAYAWIRLRLQNTESNQRSMGATGNRRFDRNATAIIEIHTLADTGMQRADELAVLARNIFEGITVDNVMFHAATAREGRQDGKFKVMLVEAPCLYEEIK